MFAAVVVLLAWRGPDWEQVGDAFTVVEWWSFSVGLLATSVLPGRIGELARVGVLARHLPSGRGIWATLTGTVFAHRLFDLFPAALLLIYVLQTDKIPHWAATSL